MRPLRLAFVSQMVGVVVSWQVVFSHWVSGCVWVLGGVARGSEGPSEQVSGEGGTVGVHGGSPHPGVSPGMFLLPCHHPAHLTPLIGGEEGGGGGFVIRVSFGLLGGCSTTESQWK
jgi:hypothetical protein